MNIATKIVQTVARTKFILDLRNGTRGVVSFFSDRCRFLRLPAEYHHWLYNGIAGVCGQ